MKRFFLAVLSVCKWYFLLVGLIVTLSFIWVLNSISKISSNLVKPQKDSSIVDTNYRVVSIKLDGAIYDEDSSSSNIMKESLYSDKSALLYQDVVRLIQKAKEDQKVEGMLVQIEDSEKLSSIMISRLHEELKRFKEAGKFVFASIRQMDTKTLLLSSIADKRIINPTGGVMLVGYDFSLMYLGSFMKKIGVNVNVVRMGEYKNAFEFLVQDTPSKETLEEYTKLGSLVEDYYVDVISKNMKVDKKQVATWFKQGMYSVRDAELEGMVEVGYVEDYLKEAVKDIDLKENIISYGKYLGKASSGLYSFFSRSDSQEVYEDSIGIISLDGQIGIEAGTSSGINPSSFNAMYRWAMNPKIKGVVLKINSPGGELVSSDLIWHKLKELSELKPVVVSMQEMAASGGYYIASASNYILAHPTTITGSIGVIGMIPKFEAFKEKYGISFSDISSSDRKSLLDKGSSVSMEDKRLMQESIRGHYNTFLERVVAGRGKDINYWDKFGRGRVYLGVQAKDLSLIDGFGDEREAVAKAKQLAGIDSEDMPTVRYQKSADFLQLIRTSIPVLGRAFGLEGMFKLDSLEIKKSNYQWILDSRKNKFFALSPMLIESKI